MLRDQLPGEIGGRALAGPASREEGREVQECSRNMSAAPNSLRPPVLLVASLPRPRLLGRPDPARPRRTGTGAATNASSLRRSCSSRSRSKSSIRSRNASHNWSTHRLRRFNCASLFAGTMTRRRLSCEEGLGRALAGRGALRAPFGRNSKSPMGRSQRAPAIVHRVRQSDHLHPPRTWAHHPDGEDHKWPHVHHVVCDQKGLSCIHLVMKNAARPASTPRFLRITRPAASAPDRRPS
jgi:hypothetical protein